MNPATGRTGVALVLGLLATASVVPLLGPTPAGAVAQAACIYGAATAVDDAGGRIADVDLSHVSVVSVNARLNGAGQQYAININRDAPGVPDVDSGNLTITSQAGTDAPQVAMSGDGKVLVFTATGDPTGGNADGNRELFRWEQGGSLVQVTNTTGGGTQAHLLPSLDEDGDRGVLLSNRSYGSNADGNLEVVRITNETTLTQVTTTTGSAHGSRPAISLNGLTVAYGSRANIVGANPDLNPEVFRFTDGSLFTYQVTSTTDATLLPTPTLTDDLEVAFDLDTDQLTNGNPEGNTEVFVFRGVIDGVGDMDQITRTTGGASTRPDINAAGTVIGFTSTAAIGGTNPGLLPYPVRWARTGGFTRVSPVAAASDPAGTRIDGAGEMVSFRSTVDEQGSNDDGSLELLNYRCNTFPDVPVSHTFWRDVEWMSSEGITTGFPNGTYRPSQAVSRQAMAAFLYRLVGEPDYDAPGQPTFVDVPLSSSFFEEVEWLNSNGITTGFPDGTFRPQGTVTRAAMSAFMFRMEDPSFPDPPTATFPDVPTDHIFFTEIEYMVVADITTGFGDGTFRPGRAVTRQAMSAFMHRLAPHLEDDSF
jgi:hypothetical protein